jgi:hypothetical protein
VRWHKLFVHFRTAVFEVFRLVNGSWFSYQTHVWHFPTSYLFQEKFDFISFGLVIIPVWVIDLTSRTEFEIVFCRIHDWPAWIINDRFLEVQIKVKKIYIPIGKRAIKKNLWERDRKERVRWIEWDELDHE